MPLHEQTSPHLRAVHAKKCEMSQFELWATGVGSFVLTKEIDGNYINGKTRVAFRAWVARSRLEDAKDTKP